MDLSKLEETLGGHDSQVWRFPAAEPASPLLPASSPLRWQLRPMLDKVPGHSRRRHHTEASYRRTHGKGRCHESVLSIAIEKSTPLATEPQEFDHE
jgi:hypothetical protein